MLNSAKAHTLLFSGTQISTPLAERTPRQYIDLQCSLTCVCRSPSLPPPSIQTTTCLPATMQVSRAGCGPPHAPTRRPKRQEGSARHHARTHTGDCMTRDGDDLRTRFPEVTIRTTRGGTVRAPQPTGSTRLLTRRNRDHPPPGSGASRHQLSPAPGERLQLVSPSSTEHHRRHLDSPRSTEHHPRARGTGASKPTPTRP